MLVAQRLQMLGLGHVEVLAPQPVPQPFAPHRAPKLAGPFAVERQQLFHRLDALVVQPLLGLRADAGQVAQRELAQGFGQDVERKRHQPVGLLHVAGHFSQIAVGGQADRTAHHGADPLQDAPLHLPAQLHRRQQRPLAPHQPAGHLVDRQHRRHRQAALHRLDDAVMVVDIDLVPRLDQLDIGAHVLGVGHYGPGLNAKGFGFVTCCNANRCVGHHGHNAHRPAAQLGAHLLLHRGKIGVQIDKQPVQKRAAFRLRFRLPRQAIRLLRQSLKLLRPLSGYRVQCRIGAGGHIRIIFAFSSLLGKRKIPMVDYASRSSPGQEKLQGA